MIIYKVKCRLSSRYYVNDVVDLVKFNSLGFRAIDSQKDDVNCRFIPEVEVGTLNVSHATKNMPLSSS